MNDMTHEQAMRHISQNIRYRLLILGWTVDRLSRECPEVPRNTIYRISRGENLGLAHQLLAIAETLGVTVDALLKKPSSEILKKLDSTG